MIEIYLEDTLTHMFKVLEQETEVTEILNKSIVKKVNDITYFVLK